MSVAGHLLVCLGIFTCVWACVRCLDTFGHMSMHFEIFGFIWMPLGLWIQLDSFGYNWTHWEVVM